MPLLDDRTLRQWCVFRAPKGCLRTIPETVGADMLRTRIDLVRLLEGFAVGAFTSVAPIALATFFVNPFWGFATLMFGFVIALVVAYFICLPIFALLRALNLI